MAQQLRNKQGNVVSANRLWYATMIGTPTTSCPDGLTDAGMSLSPLVAREGSDGILGDAALGLGIST